MTSPLITNDAIVFGMLSATLGTYGAILRAYLMQMAAPT
jgi:hypothetical protein